MKDFNNLMDTELKRGTELHGDFNSLHEGIAVIREEYLELEAEVFKRRPDMENLKAEAVQVAAMCKKIYELADQVVQNRRERASRICRNCQWNDTPDLGYSTCLISDDSGNWLNYSQDYGCNQFAALVNNQQ